MLSQRALGRALLARQLLLDRQTMPAVAAIEHLVGLQAQAPLAPYVALWSRLRDFEPAELSDAIVDRRAVRTSLMRATIHLVSADDALTLRPLIQPVLERGYRNSPFGRKVAGEDLGEILAVGRELVEARARTGPELARLLGARWPDLPVDSLAYAVGYLVPLVHVPPRGVWGRTGPVARTSMESWLGRQLAPDPSLDDLVLRYLGAFGPATVADIQAWSGLTRLREVVDRLRPRLEHLRDERGRELFDLPEAPRPDPETPAPARFLPEYDNVLLGHADRSRIIPAGRSIPLAPGNGASMGTILVDGMLAGTWRIARDASGATLAVEPYEPIARSGRIGLEEEGHRLLAFRGDTAGRDRDPDPDPVDCGRAVAPSSRPAATEPGVPTGMSAVPSNIPADRSGSREPATVRVAMWSARHRWPVVALWFVATIGLFVVSLSMGGINAADANGNPNERQLEASEAYDVFNAGGTNDPYEQFVVVVGGAPGRGRPIPRSRRRSATSSRSSTAAGATSTASRRRPSTSWSTRSTAPPAAGLVSPDGSTVRIVGRIPGDDDRRSRRCSRRSGRSSTTPAPPTRA